MKKEYKFGKFGLKSHYVYIGDGKINIKYGGVAMFGSKGTFNEKSIDIKNISSVNVVRPFTNPGNITFIMNSGENVQIETFSPIQYKDSLEIKHYIDNI